VPTVQTRHIEALERLIDELNEVVGPLANFLLPGGSPARAQLHVARRSAGGPKRVTTTLAREEPIGPTVLPYLNRLSDALFVMARYENHDRGVAEPLWDPGAEPQPRHCALTVRPAHATSMRRPILDPDGAARRRDDAAYSPSGAARAACGSSAASRRQRQPAPTVPLIVTGRPSSRSRREVAVAMAVRIDELRTSWPSIGEGGTTTTSKPTRRRARRARRCPAPLEAERAHPGS
jgi:hypothetical protein